jgi:hypothetical protein
MSSFVRHLLAVRVDLRSEVDILSDCHQSMLEVQDEKHHGIGVRVLRYEGFQERLNLLEALQISRVIERDSTKRRREAPPTVPIGIVETSPLN